jgi:hypothetical protein
VNRQEHDNENPDQDQRMLDLLLDGPVESVDDLHHPARCFKRRRGLKYDTQTLSVRIEGSDVVGNLFIFAAMVRVLGAVLEQRAVQLLDVILREW